KNELKLEGETNQMRTHQHPHFPHFFSCDLMKLLPAWSLHHVSWWKGGNLSHISREESHTFSCTKQSGLSQARQNREGYSISRSCAAVVRPRSALFHPVIHN
ncbi:hypothetical protein AMECASPLE_023741, partial [Ameca splendens]